MMYEFEDMHRVSRMDEMAILRSAQSGGDGFRHFGLDDGLEVSAKIVAEDMSAAIQSDKNAYNAAQTVLKLAIRLYSRETIAISGSREEGNEKGRLYSVVNARLRNITGLARRRDPEELSKAVRDACGDLTDFVLLCWEGLKTCFRVTPTPPAKELELFRGVELPQEAFDGYAKNIDRFVAWSGFTSFSTEEAVARGFAQAGRGGVPVIFRLSSAGRPKIESLSDVREEKELVLHPFSPLQIESIDVNASPRVITLVEPEVLRERAKADILTVYDSGTSDVTFDPKRKVLVILVPAPDGLAESVFLSARSAERLVVGAKCTELRGTCGVFLRKVRVLDLRRAPATLKVAPGAFVGMNIEEVLVGGLGASAWKFCAGFIDAFDLCASSSAGRVRGRR
jgi:hypothetical protein